MLHIGEFLVSLLDRPFREIAPYMPGDVFPYFFTLEMFQRSLVAAIIVTIVAGFLGVFLIIRNLSLIGDGLAHVSFGGVAVALVVGSVNPLWYALIFSVVASVLIYELQHREILTGDASIAIFLTGTLALGLVVLRTGENAVTTDIEGWLFGSLLLIDSESLNLIILLCVPSIIVLALLKPALLACTIDPLAAKVQGLPVRVIGLAFSVITALVVVSMVQIVGALLVTALLVTPAATAQQVASSFKSCIIWTQFFGISSLFIGLYFSAEENTGSGSMIALVAAIIFAIVVITKNTYKFFTSANNA